MANRDTQNPSDTPSEPPANPRIDVVIGIVYWEGKVLVGKRTHGKPLPGYWEFPGGKVDPNESLEQALIRELAEETGLTVRPSQPIWSAEHLYSYGRVPITAWWCDCDIGDAKPLATDQLAWVNAGQLADLSFPPANTDLVAEVVRRMDGLKE